MRKCKTIGRCALAITALQLLASCGDTYTITTPRPPPPAPDLGSADIIPIEWISTQSHVVRNGTERIATGQEIIFRSQDSRIYQIDTLTSPYLSIAFARLSSGKAIGFVNDYRYSVPDQVRIFPNWPFGPEPGRTDSQSGCVPQIEGFEQIFKDDRAYPAIGIWHSATTHVWRVIVYAHDYHCPDAAGQDRRFSTILSEDTPWRLVRMGPIENRTSVFQLLSGAEMGEPIHYASYQIATEGWLGR